MAMETPVVSASLPGRMRAALVVGGAWQGPVSFRKPAIFGLSFGLTTITLAWITGRLRIVGRTRWLLLGPLAVAEATEVGWACVQRWRGVASHFNLAPSWTPRCLWWAGPRSRSP